VDKKTALIAANKAKLPTQGLQEYAESLSMADLTAYLDKAPAMPALAGMQSDNHNPAHASVAELSRQDFDSDAEWNAWQWAEAKMKQAEDEGRA